MNLEQPDNEMKVGDDMVVTLDYTLRLDDGEIVDSTEGEEPLEILQGFGQIIPGLEDALYGMAVGEEKDVVVPPEDAYGDVDDEDYQTLPRDVFPADMPLEAGMILDLHDMSTGESLEATVTEVMPDSVLLDLNHPLAGETLHFHVKVTAIRQATDDELEHGHVHEQDGHEH